MVRNELKAPFVELIVSGRREMAARADCDRTLARSYGHFNALLVGTEVDLLVDKTPETMAAVLDLVGQKKSKGIPVRVTCQV